MPNAPGLAQESLVDANAPPEGELDQRQQPHQDDEERHPLSDPPPRRPDWLSAQKPQRDPASRMLTAAFALIEEVLPAIRVRASRPQISPTRRARRQHRAAGQDRRRLLSGHSRGGPPSTRAPAPLLWICAVPPVFPRGRRPAGDRFGFSINIIVPGSACPYAQLRIRARHQRRAVSERQQRCQQPGPSAAAVGSCRWR